MDLFEDISQPQNIRGITLNSQNIDLFNIIQQAKSREDATEKIYEYLNEILQARQMSDKINSQKLSIAQKIRKVVDEKASNEINKEDFYKFLLENAMQIRAHWDSKVQALYNYVIGNLENGENRFTRLTIVSNNKQKEFKLYDRKSRYRI